MRIIAISTLILAALPAFATGGHQPTPTPPPQFVVDQSAAASASAAANSTASAAANPSASVSGVYSGGGQAQGGSVTDQSRMWALPAPAPAASIPGGLCIVSESMQASGLSFGYGKANSRTDMECLREWFKLQRELLAAAPQPAPQPIFFPLAPAPVATPAAPATAVLPPPAPVKPASAPAKKRNAPKKTAAAALGCPVGQVSACQAPAGANR